MNGNGSDPRGPEYAQGTVLILCIIGILVIAGASFYKDPVYDKGVYICLTSLISIATGILFGRAVSTPIFPTTTVPPTVTTTTATTEPAKVTTTTAPLGVAPVTTTVEEKPEV